MSAAAPVTVVIPARDAATTIDAQLAALAAQDHPGPITVIVADNGSVDGTGARVEAWADRLPDVRVVDAGDRPGAAHARNVGTAAAATDLVLCCDADDVADPAWVRHLVAGLGDADVVAGGTASFVGAAPSGPSPPGGFGTAGFGFLPALTTASCGYHRRVWEAVGGFDEDLPLACEDLDFGWRVQLAGFTLAQVPEGYVHYREAPTATAVLRRWYRYGAAQPRLFRRFGPSGLRRDPPTRVLAAWARLVLHGYRLLQGGTARRHWCRDAGRRAGRLTGSLRTRTWYL